MNIRVISIVLIILLFTFTSGALGYSVSGGIPLKEAYDNGNIKVIQKTASGTVPHEVLITNNENNAIKVKRGDVLASTVSQDLVIAEDKKVLPDSNETIKVYGLSPSKRAITNTRLLPVNNTYSAVNKVISNSSISDPESAMKTQLQIWVITSGSNLNPYTGEPVAVVETHNITWKQFRQDIANAKNEVMNLFNVTEEGIKDLNQTQFAGQNMSMIDNAINWIKESLGIRQ